MMEYQIKKERPTLRAAHNFCKGGSFSFDPNRNLLRGSQREAEIKSVTNKLATVVKEQFPRTACLEYAILKAHLIFDYALTQYIRCFAAVAVADEDIRFSFSQKLEFAYLLGFGVHDPILLPTMEQINKVRNQVAHTFAINRSLVDEILRINNDDYSSYHPNSDKDRIGALRSIVACVCGRMAGEIEASFQIAMLAVPDGTQP